MPHLHRSQIRWLLLSVQLSVTNEVARLLKSPLLYSAAAYKDHKQVYSLRTRYYTV
jgi:hypothetical protein